MDAPLDNRQIEYGDPENVLGTADGIGAKSLLHLN